MMTHRYFMTAICLSAVLLTACGGGDEDAPGPAPPPSSGSYLFYSGSLNAVDPSNPTAPITVEPGNNISPMSTVYSTDYNGGSRTSSNQNAHALIYAKTDGKLYRVSALKSGALIPEQVSSENTANNVCSAFARTDLSNPVNAPYVYLQAGPDNDCNTAIDNTWKMVRLGMSPSDSPIPAKQPLVSLIDNNSGAISGWLINDNGTLSQCDANFANCTAITFTPGNASVIMNIDTINNRFLMLIDDAFYIYDGNNTSTPFLSQKLFSIPSGTLALTFPITDGTHVYFGLHKFIYRFPTDGTTVVDINAPLYADTGTANISSLDLTTNKVIFQTGQLIRAISKDGGLPLTLALTPSPNRIDYIHSGDYIYYEITTSTAIHAGIVNENGANRTIFNNATWIGALLSKTTNYTNRTRQLDEPSVLILAQGSGNGLSGAVLKAIDGNTATESAILGTLPKTDELILFFCTGLANDALCLAAANSNLPAPASPVQLDVFFLNAEITNSLQRVTSTKDTNEIPVF